MQRRGTDFSLWEVECIQGEVIFTIYHFPFVLSTTPELKPDVIVLDIHMPLMNGLFAGQRLKQIMPRVKLLYLTMSLDPDLAAEAFRMGA